MSVNISKSKKEASTYSLSLLLFLVLRFEVGAEGGNESGVLEFGISFEQGVIQGKTGDLQQPVWHHQNCRLELGHQIARILIQHLKMIILIEKLMDIFRILYLPL